MQLLQTMCFNNVCLMQVDAYNGIQVVFDCLKQAIGHPNTEQTADFGKREIIAILNTISVLFRSEKIVVKALETK